MKWFLCFAMLSLSAGEYDRFFGDRTAKTEYYSAEELTSQQDLAEYETFQQYFYQEKVAKRTIPHTIHFIWLGHRPFPQSSWSNVIHARQLHPNWKLILWTDQVNFFSPIENLEIRQVSEIPMGRWETFYCDTENMGERSDILRCVVLQREGGVYLDHDIELYRSLEPLAKQVSFFAFLEPLRESLTLDTKFTITNCMFGSAPDEPLFDQMYDTVAGRWEKYKNLYPGRDVLSDILRVLNRTFDPFSMTVRKHLSRHDLLVLPPNYLFGSHIFYSLGREEGDPIGNHQWKGTWAIESLPSSTISRYNILEISKKGMKKIAKNVENIFVVNLFLFLILASIVTYHLIDGRSFRIQRPRNSSSPSRND